MLLWQEYISAHPDGYQYSWFSERYRTWRRTIDPVMRQHHKAGEKLFVDYAGQTISITDATTGELREAQIFVATLGASNYTYAEAAHSQGLEDWIGAHVRAFTYFGGVPEVVVCDNLRSGVSKTCRYEPELNPTYADLAAHYGVAIVPARARKPRDKAKVESGVQVVERWILARLRHRTFFSVGELNEAIAALLDDLNERPFQKLAGSRRSHFKERERPLLKALPNDRYEFAEWIGDVHRRKAGVNIDYHVEVERHYYSVPYTYLRKRVDVRLSGLTVEIFYRGERIASHRRNAHRDHHTTVKEHMPPSHRKYAEWTPERITSWAAKIGPQTAKLAEQIMASRPHVQQGYRSCLGILRLEKAYGAERLEAASARAVAIGARSYKSVASILQHNLDGRPLPRPAGPQPAPLCHDNIRGANYYAANEPLTC